MGMTEAHIYRQKLALVVGDILAVLTAFAIAMQLRFSAALGIFEPSVPPWAEMLQSLPVMLSVWLFTLKATGAYATEKRRLVYEIARVFNALFVMAAILLSI